MYVDRDYAESRLHGTLVRLNGKPVLITGVRDGMECEYRDPFTGNYDTTHLDNLNLKSPPLGFVNTDGGCEYLSRRPMRNDWRQGVRTNSVVSQRDGRNGGRPEINTVAKCMLGEFPSKSTVLRKLREGANGVAISREFCLTRVGSRTIIKYKWYGAVGKLTSKGAILDVKWKHLQKIIDEVLR